MSFGMMEFSSLGDVDSNSQTEIFFQLEHC